MTVTNPAILRQLVTRSDNHPALLVPESGVSVSYAELQRALDQATHSEGLMTAALPAMSAGTAGFITFWRG